MFRRVQVCIVTFLAWLDSHPDQRIGADGS